MAGAGVRRGRLPGATSLACPGVSQPWEPRGDTTQPTPGTTGESTEGSLGVKKRLKLPVGTQYYAVESARGHYGILLVSEGGLEPYRAKFRTPSYPNLAVLGEVMPGNMHIDNLAKDVHAG